MNTRHIQNFLMMSAAFFAMGGPVYAGAPHALAAAGMRVSRLASEPDATVARPSAAAYLYEQAR